MKKAFLQLHPKDNVLPALHDIESGCLIEFNGDSFKTTEDIPAKHKFALKHFDKGDTIIMYGALVGEAIATISKGARISVENCEHASSEYGVNSGSFSWSAPDVSKWQSKTFNGYHREDGSVGTANHWLVIPMVFCENRNVEVMKSALQESLGYLTTTDFVVDTNTLVNQYKNGASAAEILGSQIIRTPEEVKQNRTFPNVD
jgi:altronate hydrolase